MVRVLALGLVLLLAAGTSADIVQYSVPNTTLVVTMEGSTTVNAGRTITFRHPKFGKLIFALERAKIYKSPTTYSLAERRLQKAVSSNDVEKILAAGSWALHQGQLKTFYKAAATAWGVDAEHPAVKRLVRVKQEMNVNLGPSEKQEAELRKFIRNKSGMKIKVSKHFVLLYDTSDEPLPGTRKTRADQRLELLETVYESFLLKFYSEGIELVVPRERLKVVLFSSHKDYLNFVTLLGPSLKSAAGFFIRKENISVFYDQGTDESLKPLLQLDKALQEAKVVAKKRRSAGTRDIVRMADTISMLTKISAANSDIEVVSHEVTHQMASNTGVMPPDAPVPRWAAEGLATYFESPKEAAWSGIGAVNKQRLERYRILERDRKRSRIEFIVTDLIFITARRQDQVLHGYGQAWALTHFLMDKHFDKLITWYAKVAKMPATEKIDPRIWLQAFHEVFGNDLSTLDVEWREYMRSLKTDVEKILDEK